MLQSIYFLLSSKKTISLYNEPQTHRNLIILVLLSDKFKSSINYT